MRGATVFIPSIFYNSEGKECRHFDLSFLGEGRRGKKFTFLRGGG